MRRSRLLMLVIGLGLIVAACASPVSAPGEPSDEAPSTPAAQSEAPAESEGPAESQAAASEDGGDGAAPALADGLWTEGHANITVGGGVSLTIDEQITTDVSHTTDAKTQLAYNTDAEFVTIGFNFIGVPFHASITADDFSALSEDCEVTYNRADDTGVDGTFSCVADEFYWYSADPEPTGEVTIEGSFTASR